MEVRIGVKHVSREVVIESSQSPADVKETVGSALAGEGVLTLDDEKGRQVMVPVDAVAYVEIGVEEAGRVGFGH